VADPLRAEDVHRLVDAEAQVQVTDREQAQRRGSSVLAKGRPAYGLGANVQQALGLAGEAVQFATRTPALASWAQASKMARCDVAPFSFPCSPPWAA
jgi:alpha-tubulin suppressor-like RCC1 family protein